MVSKYRDITGFGNNEDNEEWGMADAELLRMTWASYKDGISEMWDNRPAARDISDTVMHQGDLDTVNSKGASDAWIIWGQFIDHDLDLTGESHTDLVFPKNFATPFARSEYIAGTGDDDPREHANLITSYLDASMVYGSDEVRALELRSGVDGKLKMSDGDLLPYNTAGLPNAMDSDPTDPMFLAGDVRANENANLTSYHTLFVREHNHWAEKLKAENPGWDDETLYQEAKMRVEAEIQHITYHEFLPMLLGSDWLPEYEGYDPTVNATIAQEFAHGAFRFGHSVVSGEILRTNEDGSEHESGHLGLFEAFFDPSKVEESGIDSFLRGLGEGQAQELDHMVIDDLRLLLFGNVGGVDLDLASLNIMRGRDHGLPTYKEIREALGLDPVENWSDITSDTDLQAKLAAAYGSVEKVDLWVGGLAEDKYHDAMVGETFYTILADQFIRTRDGDAYWYESRLDADTLYEIKNTSLGEIIERNTDVEYMQDDVMIAYDRIGGTDGYDKLVGDEGHDLIIGFGGNDVLKGKRGEDELYGGEGDDFILGGGQGDKIDGESGNDGLYGQGGGDYIDGNYGHDGLLGGFGSDTLYGGEGDDLLSGGQGKDFLYGGTGDDVLKGDGNRDMLTGGEGDDFMLGGYGKDTFVFDSYDFGHDVIGDFEVGRDKLDFSALDLDVQDFTVTGYYNYGSYGTVLTLDGYDASVTFTGVHKVDFLSRDHAPGSHGGGAGHYDLPSLDAFGLDLSKYGEMADAFYF